MYTFIPCTMDTTAMRKVTPISTPISEKKLLSFCAAMVRSAIRTASKTGMLGGHLGVPGVGVEAAVPQHHHPLGVGRKARPVGHHHDGLSLAVQLGADPHDLLAGGAVEVAGRFAGKE